MFLKYVAIGATHYTYCKRNCMIGIVWSHFYTSLFYYWSRLIWKFGFIEYSGREEPKFVLQTMMRMKRITYRYYSMKNRWRAGCLLTKEMFFEIACHRDRETLGMGNRGEHLVRATTCGSRMVAGILMGFSPTLFPKEDRRPRDVGATQFRFNEVILKCCSWVTVLRSSDEVSYYNGHCECSVSVNWGHVSPQERRDASLTTKKCCKAWCTLLTANSAGMGVARFLRKEI